MPSRHAQPAYQDTITDLFVRLGAPFHDTRRSWGALHPNGTVFLRVWRDRIARIPSHPGRQCVELTHLEQFPLAARRWGYTERLRHVQAIDQGAPCYLVLCEAVDPEADPRTIKRFTRDPLYRGGTLLQHEQDWWIEVGDEVTLATLLKAIKR